ncbi:MAG TPA: shikimate kinase [Flavobacteriaceae bacterium]|nr:shikimate kinase [Flavobacteriaceae bacterium]
MNIFLMGYMASGKSVIGKELAKVLNFNFVDLDQYIVEREQLTITEIFTVKGEIYFRKKEHFYLKEILNSSEKKVVALGGGTPCYGNNLKLIHTAKNTKSIYLKSSVAELSKRLFNEKHTRPLLAHVETLTQMDEFVGKHLFERQFYYNQAHITVNVEKLEKNEIVQVILRNLF